MTKSVTAPGAPAEIADSGRIRLGAGMRVPAAKPAATADAGKIRLGAGLRRAHAVT